MVKLILAVVAEIVVALGAAGVVIAAIVPMLVHTQLVHPGAPMASLVVLGILGAALAFALFRPGSAIKRYCARHK